MTSRLVDSDAMAVDDTTDTGAAARVNGDEANGARAGARPPFRIHLGRDRQVELDYRRTAIAAGALGLGVLAYRGVTALLTRRRTDDAKPHARTEAQPFQRDDETHTPPAATTPAPTATLVGTDTGAEFVGEPASRHPDAPFVAASGDDDTGGLLVEVTEIDIVTVTPVGTSDDTTTAGADRSALTPEHVPTDLMGDTPPGAGDRAIDAFRPDPTAPVPSEMRDSLRPATGPATGFAGNRGDFASGLSQADGSK
jgi:hypothetical protein